MAMAGGGPVATRTLCFDTRMLRQTNGFVAAHHLIPHWLMNRMGSYVRSVNVKARVFDPLSRPGS
jgi:hypothetical protein